MRRQIRVKIHDLWHTVEVEEPVTYPFKVVVDGEPVEVEIDAQGIGSSSSAARPTGPPPEQPSPPENVGLTGLTQENEKIIRSPMPGRIVSVSVRVWNELEAGAEICILETMKMEQSILMSHNGTVRAVFVEAGQNVAAGDPLVQLE